ncbi:hypothetical protein E5D57_004694 [Metarhizium anisopliae]|nr:hypothetical protein E5D57_004694 [Metarhizium anisopliae]
MLTRDLQALDSRNRAINSAQRVVVLLAQFTQPAISTKTQSPLAKAEIMVTEMSRALAIKPPSKQNTYLGAMSRVVYFRESPTT